jgi:hypothetical protein
MSNASVFYLKHDAQVTQNKAAAQKVVAQARSKGVKFVTYIPVDGKGEAVSVVMHEPGSPEEKQAALIEMQTKVDKKTGTKLLAGGARRGVHGLKARLATITSFGQTQSPPRPYALAFAVSYDPAKAAELRRIGHAISAHNPKFAFHVIRRAGLPGYAAVVVPVQNLTDLDKPVSASAAPLAAALKNVVTSVSMVKLKRVAGLSA